MSPLQMFLPASEPARSEALAELLRSRHLPRHLVRGIARGSGKRGSLQMQQSPPVVSPTQDQEDQLAEARRQLG
jgi:hypothetical protein